MYTFLLSLAAAVLGFALGTATVGWWAGIIPAILFFILSFYLISRSTMNKVQEIFGRAQKQIQMQPPPDLLKPGKQKEVLEWQAQQRDQVRTTMREALVIEKWQFLIKENVYAQLGMLDYQEAVEAKMMKQANVSREKLISAQANLEQAWNPTLSGLLGDWRSRVSLAAVYQRLSEPQKAVNAMADLEKSAPKDPFYWGFWGLLLVEEKKNEEALQVIGKGISACPDSSALKAFQAAVSNKQRPDMRAFGDIWYQYFPEDIPMEKQMEMARAMGMDVPAQGQGQPQQAKPIPRKTYPHPRR